MLPLFTFKGVADAPTTFFAAPALTSKPTRFAAGGTVLPEGERITGQQFFTVDTSRSRARATALPQISIAPTTAAAAQERTVFLICFISGGVLILTPTSITTRSAGGICGRITVICPVSQELFTRRKCLRASSCLTARGMSNVMPAAAVRAASQAIGGVANGFRGAAVATGLVTVPF
jgi:hypothetical protein